MTVFPATLTHLEIPEFSRLLLQQAPTQGEWTFDLSQLTHIDSAFLALLLAILRLSQARNLQLKLNALPDNAKSLLAVYGILELFKTTL